MKHNVDNCQCLGCKIFAIAKGLAHPDIWRKNLEIIMTEAAVKGLSDDEALAYVLKEFDAKLNKGIEAGMDSHICERIIDAKEWCEWHIEEWSRFGKPEPVISWLGTVHP